MAAITSCGQSCKSWYNDRVRRVASHTTRHVEKLTLDDRQGCLSKVMAVFLAALLSVVLVPWALLSATVSCCRNCFTRKSASSALRVPSVPIPASRRDSLPLQPPAPPASLGPAADLSSRGSQVPPPATNEPSPPAPRLPVPRETPPVSATTFDPMTLPLPPIGGASAAAAEQAAAPRSREAAIAEMVAFIEKLGIWVAPKDRRLLREYVEGMLLRYEEPHREFSAELADFAVNRLSPAVRGKERLLDRKAEELFAPILLARRAGPAHHVRPRSGKQEARY